MTHLLEWMNVSSSSYVHALIVLCIFVVVAKCADVFIDKVLRRFARFTHSELDDRIIDFIHRPVFYSIIILGAISAMLYLKPDKLVIFYANGILYSIITVVWCVTLIRLSNLVIEYTLRKVSDVTGMRKDVIPLIETISKIVIFVAALMIVLSFWNINITPLLASAGIVGAAVAFAAKDTIANLFGGISVFMDKPFSVGDYINLDKGERGEVVTIGLRSTRIKTRDDILITIPNSIIANTKIVNESAPVPKFRMRVPVSVAYGSDIDLVERTLLEIAAGNDNVLSEPAPRVRFRVFGDSSLDFELLCWAKEPALRGRTLHELNAFIYKKFTESGIRIPFPQRDVYIHQT